MARAETWATERVEQVIADLERLKSRVAQIEMHYGVLSSDYTQICEEALSMVSKLKPVIATAVQSTARRTSHNGKRKRVKKKLGSAVVSCRRNNNLPKIKEIENQPEVYDTAKVERILGNVGDQGEAGGFKIEAPEAEVIYAEKAPAETVAETQNKMELETVGVTPPVELLELGYSSLSLEELLKFQKTSGLSAPKRRVTPQSVIDLLGRGIEFALDTLGDGLTFPFVLVVRLARKLSGSAQSKK
jgi:hypothetical protein